MFEKLKEKLRIHRLARKPISQLATPKTFKEKLVSVADTAIKSIPGGGITLTAVVLTVIAMVMGHLMATASIAGVMLSVSIGCLYAGASPKFKEALLWMCAKFGWYLDVLVTILFTIAGFHLGATLGVVGMVLGLHVSMMMSIAREVYYKKYPEEKPVASVSTTQPSLQAA